MAEGGHYDNIFIGNTLKNKGMFTLNETHDQQDIKIVYAKWLDDKKPIDGDDANVRSRMVATDLNLCVREDCTQSTPPRKVFRILVSAAATKVAPDGSRRRLIGRHDVKVAFFHADGDGKTAVMDQRS